jgi:type IV pilus assembly protein PilV
MVNDTGQQGFTLIEVLVAVLVLALGMLGMAGLQSYAVANTHSAYLRSQATILAYDMVDRMRANRQDAQIGSYDVAFNTPPTGAFNCENNVCANTANMASFDLDQWKCMLGAWNADPVCAGMNITGRLPNGDGQITRNGLVHTVTVRWDDRDVDARDGNGAVSTVSLQVSTEL